MEASAAWRVEDLLVLAVFADLVVFVVLTTSDDPGFLRYLTAAVIFGTVLAGRWVGRLAASFSSALPVRRGAAAVCVAVVAAFAAAFGFTLAAPMPKQPNAQLDRFLEARQLVVGIGDYWSASITTVATSGGVTVRPVITTPAGRVVRYQRQSAADLVHESVIRVPRLRHRQAVGRHRRQHGLVDVRPRRPDLRGRLLSRYWSGGTRSRCRAQASRPCPCHPTILSATPNRASPGADRRDLPRKLEDARPTSVSSA